MSNWSQQACSSLRIFVGQAVLAGKFKECQACDCQGSYKQYKV